MEEPLGLEECPYGQEEMVRRQEAVLQVEARNHLAHPARVESNRTVHQLRNIIGGGNGGDGTGYQNNDSGVADFASWCGGGVPKGLSVTVNGANVDAG